MFSLRHLENEIRLLKKQLGDMKCLFDMNKDDEKKKHAEENIKKLEKLIGEIEKYKTELDADKESTA